MSTVLFKVENGVFRILGRTSVDIIKELILFINVLAKIS